MLTERMVHPAALPPKRMRTAFSTARTWFARTLRRVGTPPGALRPVGTSESDLATHRYAIAAPCDPSVRLGTTLRRIGTQSRPQYPDISGHPVYR